LRCHEFGVLGNANLRVVGHGPELEDRKQQSARRCAQRSRTAGVRDSGGVVTVPTDPGVDLRRGCSLEPGS
jgi:hypothetical protein